jgi:hypothetical protein
LHRKVSLSYDPRTSLRRACPHIILEWQYIWANWLFMPHNKKCEIQEKLSPKYFCSVIYFIFCHSIITLLILHFHIHILTQWHSLVGWYIWSKHLGLLELSIAGVRWLFLFNQMVDKYSLTLWSHRQADKCFSYINKRDCLSCQSKDLQD